MNGKDTEESTIMRRTQRTIGWVAIFVAMTCCKANAGEDWQYWSTWKASHKLSDVSAMSALAEVYYRDDMSDDYVYDEYVTYSRQLGYGFGLLGQAYFESVEMSQNEWRSKRSAVGGITYATDIPYVGKIKLQDRLFYKVSSSAHWDYHRPRVFLMRDVGPVKLTLSDELRLDLSGDRPDDFFRNRVFAMVSGNVTDELTLGLGYVRQSDKVDGDWASFNVMQTLVSYAF